MASFCREHSGCPKHFPITGFRGRLNKGSNLSFPGQDPQIPGAQFQSFIQRLAGQTETVLLDNSPIVAPLAGKRRASI